MIKLFKKISLAWKTRNAVKKIKEAYMKEGIKSSEFWISAVTWISVLLVAAMGLLDPKTATAILAGIAVVYTIARTIVKITPSTKDDELLEKFEKILRDKGLLK
jgi:hypothetical protein